MKYIKSYSKFENIGMGSLYHTMYPYQYNTIDNPTDRGKEGNLEYYDNVNNFQSIQNEIKKILFKDLIKRDKNITDIDIENKLKEFLNVNDSIKQEIRKISDNCKNIKNCAREIYNKCKIYKNLQNDNINDVEIISENKIDFEFDNEEFDNEEFVVDFEKYYHGYYSGTFLSKGKKWIFGYFKVSGKIESIANFRFEKVIRFRNNNLLIKLNSLKKIE